MAKRIGDILPHIKDRIPVGVVVTRHEVAPVCEVCGGVGWLRLDAPVGDPNFGRLVPCDCRLAEVEDTMRRELEDASNLEAFATKTFDRMEPSVHENVRAALAVARDYARDPNGWLFLTGPCGSGKTHLAAAVANESIRQRRVQSLFMIVPDLLDYLRETYNPHSEVTYDQRFEKIRSVSLLVLDDLGTENATTWAREKLFQIINHRYNTRLPTVITTNQDLESVDERIRSRISDRDLVKHVVLEAPDYRRRSEPPGRRTSRPQNGRRTL